MTGEHPTSVGSVNSVGEAMGLDPRNPAVLANFTHALAQWRKETVVEEVPPTVEFAGLLLERHLGSSVSTPSDLQLEGDWQPTPTDVAAVRVPEEMVGLPPQERHSCDH